MEYDEINCRETSDTVDDGCARVCFIYQSSGSHDPALLLAI